MDETGVVIVIIDDYQGALKDTWDVREFTRMEVRDEAANVIFRGYVTGKKFENKQFTMTISGISKVLQWTPMDKQYTLASGLVSAVPDGHSDNSLTVQQETDPATDFDWDNDQWITEPNDNVGILIRENSETPTKTTYTVEDSGAPEDFTTEGTYISGDENSFDEIDEIYYYSIDNDPGGGLIKITPEIKGANIPTVQKLISIDINFQWAAKTVAAGYAEFHGYIKKDTEYIKFTEIICHATDDYRWDFGTFHIDESHTELAKYLTIDGVNYDEIKEIYFVCVITSHNCEIAIDKLTVDINHFTYDISPIMAPITDNGLTFLETATIDYTESGVEVGDKFTIGQNTGAIIQDIANTCGIGIALLSTPSKYISQLIKGIYGLGILKKVCILEGWHWREDYATGTFGQLVVSHLDDCVDSGVDLTQADHDHDWVFEDDPDFFSKVKVYGSAAYRIEQTAIDTTIKSPKTKVIYEETITTNSEALEVAKTQLLEWKVKHPSIKLSLKGTHTDLKVGTTVTITMVRPRVDEAQYPIRMVERERLGHGEIKTTVYAGMGHTTANEKLDDRINKIMYLAQKAVTDRLGSTPLGAGISGLPWTEIIGGDSAVLAIIVAELVDGQSIDQAIDDLITIHTAFVNPHATTLSDINNPSGNKEFNFANKHLHFKWVAPASEAHEGAFEIEASGAFSGDLIHIHQHTGNVGANTYMVFIECEDDDASCLRLVHTDQVFDFGVNGLNLNANLTLAAARVIASADEDLTFKFGRAQIDSRWSDFMIISHRDMSGGNNYALGQSPDGKTYINAPTGKLIYFHINDVEKMSMGTTGLALGIPIIMGANKITGVAKGTNANDALALNTNLIDSAYDPDVWTEAEVAPSRVSVKNVFVALTGAVFYQGTYTPGDAYPANPEVGHWYICDADGYTAAPGGADNTPARWYEIGDWVIWNEVETRWDILRNVQGDNILKVSPGDSIQTAIDEIESIGEGAIVLMPGTHNSGALTFNNVNVYIEMYGFGDVSILKPTGDFNAITATNFKSLTLKDFKIDCSLQTTVGKNGININEANNNKCIIENITGVGDDLVTSDGIKALSENVIIRNCNLSTMRIGIIVTAGADKCNIYENTFNNIGFYNIFIDASDYVICDLNRIDGNGEVANRGIYVNNSQHVSLTDNYVDDCIIGISLNNQSDDGTYIGNTVLNCSGQGIFVDVGDKNTITANVITDCGDGIELGAGASYNYITVNQISGSAGEDIDDNSDGTNYILDRNRIIKTNTINLRPMSNSGIFLEGRPYISLQGEYFIAETYIDDKIDVSKDITYNWIIQRIGALSWPLINMNSGCGHAVCDGSTNPSYTNIENDVGFVPRIDAALDTLNITRTITGGTISIDSILGMKLINNDVGHPAMRCFGLQIRYHVKLESI